MSRWLVIVNPQAANGKVERQWAILYPKLALLLPNLEVEMSGKVGNATAIISAAVERGIRHVLAVGGDGTAHQVMNGIMQQQLVPSREVTFALLPLGTGNDWIKSHGIPRGWDAWQQYMKRARPQYQNLGKITFQTKHGIADRYFMNVAGLAYDAFVVRYTDGKSSPLPGKLFYFLATFRCLFAYQPQRASLIYDGYRHEDSFYTINIGIGRYSGGGMQLVPHAKSRGDNFALTYVGRISRLGLMLNSFRFYQGRISTFKKAHLTHVSRVEIVPATGEEMLIEADGEFLGRCPASITLLQDALCFLAPAKP